MRDAVYLERLRALRESKESLEVIASGAVSAEVLHAIYQQIVTGRTTVSIRLTAAVYAHGLAVALAVPEPFTGAD